MIQLFKNLFNRAANHEGLKIYGANMSWLFAEKIFRMAIGFTVGIYVAYKLGPAQYGLLNYAIGLAMIFSICAALGLDQILVRELVKHPEERDKLMGTSLALRLTGFVLMVVSVGVGLYFMGSDRKTSILVMLIVSGYLFQSFQTIDYYFQAKVQSKYIAISQIIAWTIISSLRLAFAWRGMELIYFAGLEAANMALMSLGYIVFYCFKAASLLKWRASVSTAVYLLGRSWKLILSSLAVVVYMRIDQVMIKEILGDNPAGQYALAIRFCEMWYIIPGILASTFFPSIIRAKEISQEHYHHRLQLLFTLMSWLSIGIAVGLTLLSPLIVMFLPQYAESSTIIMIYAWVLPFTFWGAVNGAWCIAESQLTIALIMPLINSIFNVILNYLLIHKIGLCGAALATLASYFITTIIIQSIVPQTRILVKMTFKSLFPIFLIANLNRNSK
jgi:O-antigen/teichoic acid export membrane protein